MLTRLGTNKVNGRDSVCLSRADSVRRWATEGSRAFTGIQGEPLHVSSRSNPVLHRRSWFGSSGERTGYTPKGVRMVLADQKTAVFRYGVVTGTIYHYKARFKLITVRRACQILRDIGSGDDVFYWISCAGSYNKWRGTWTPNKILEQIVYSNDPAKSQLGSWYASDVSQISFTGGPPDKWGTYYGSLHTLLLDRIAVIVLFEGVAALDKIITPTERYSGFA